VIIINSVLTLQVSTAKPMIADLLEERLRSSTLDSLHTGVSPGSIGCEYTYSGPFREAQISVQPLWGFSPSNPDPVPVTCRTVINKIWLIFLLFTHCVPDPRASLYYCLLLKLSCVCNIVTPTWNIPILLQILETISYKTIFF
jgi:hypothetical protein